MQVSYAGLGLVLGDKVDGLTDADDVQLLIAYIIRRTRLRPLTYIHN